MTRQHLLDKRRLSHLPRAGDHLDEPARLGQTPGEHGALRTLVRWGHETYSVT